MLFQYLTEIKNEEQNPSADEHRCLLGWVGTAHPTPDSQIPARSPRPSLRPGGLRSGRATPTKPVVVNAAQKEKEMAGGIGARPAGTHVRSPPATPPANLPAKLGSRGPHTATARRRVGPEDSRNSRQQAACRYREARGPTFASHYVDRLCIASVRRNVVPERRVTA
jgi:hypothetical protein